MKLKEVERVLYFENFIVIEPGLTGLKKNQLLSEEELIKYQDEFGDEAFTAGIGAEAILEILKSIDLQKEKELLDLNYETKYSIYYMMTPQIIHQKVSGMPLSMSLNSKIS